MPPIQTLASARVSGLETPLFTRADDTFSTPAETSPCGSFFRSLRPPSPPKPPTSYNSFFSTPATIPPNPPQLSAASAILECSASKAFGSSSINPSFPALSEVISMFGRFKTSDDFVMDMSLRTPPPASKRKERASLPTDTPSPHGQTPKRRRPDLTVEQKLEQLFDLLKTLDWTLGEALHHIFAHKDPDNLPLHRSQRHGLIVESYLAGKSRYTVSGIIGAMLTSPYGRSKDEMIFDTETSYLLVRPVRQALTAFAAQTCVDYLEEESRAVVKSSGGLWVKRREKDGEYDNVKWEDLGAAIQHATSSLLENQHLAVKFLRVIAEPKPRSRGGVITIRKSRPHENVVISCLSTLDFCKNDQARLLPLARGILYLSSNVPAEIIAHSCRLGTSPSIKTITTALEEFSDQKAVIIRTRGRDISVIHNPDGSLTTMAKVIIFDNVQHFHKQRDLRIGRENSMVIGIAATFFEFPVDVRALDPLDKRQRIEQSNRPNITVEDLLGMIDQQHLKDVGALQFAEALTNYIPSAAIYKKEIYDLYRTQREERHTLPNSKRHSLTSYANSASSKETTIRVYGLGGGDGMSYNNMLLLKQFLQNHPDLFESFELLRPVLQLWHLMWTDLCRINDTHWAQKKIGRAPPANLKKVDYYPSAQLLNLVRDMCMLDCWVLHFNTTDIFGYFEDRAKWGALPQFEEIDTVSKTLFDTYVSPRMRHQIRVDARDEATSDIPRALLGAPWQQPTTTSTPTQNPKKRAPKILKVGSAKATTTKKKVAVEVPKPTFLGDQVAFDNGTFMYNAMLSREVAAAVTQGAVGRVWEAVKIMVFTFAGSAHSKYTGYLLEMIVDLEMESNPFLRDTTLMSTVINPDSKEGGSKACDIFQEFLNRCIDPVVQRKDTDYGAHHVRNVWSRNIKDIYDLKTDFRSSLGLEKRSSRHKKLHERPEVKTLLCEYQAVELNKRRPGRTFDNGRDVDNFLAGIQALKGGVLRKWAKRTTNTHIRHLLHSSPSSDSNSQIPEDSEHESDWEDDSEDEEPVLMTPGDMYYHDGELIIDMGEEDDTDIIHDEDSEDE
ncbi:hypothetical protein B0H16DRAFT_1735544 [Mycena metata]|uniref:DUF6589 domain-containing protein n=1 Tax=Mycena metata TaxID=1033252 RepID=A0AAD7MPQ3_9AGAR|nr:hypothetical protein B0H16DRAFT_1735544 [Mycena metata]